MITDGKPILDACFRVLEPYGVLIFKWAETQLKLKTILALTDQKPLFGHRRGKTIWVAFMKFPTTIITDKHENT